MTIIKPAPPAGKPGKSSVGVVVPFEDKPWLGVDRSPSSPHRGNVYVAWTRFDLFGEAAWTPHTGAWVRYAELPDEDRATTDALIDEWARERWLQRLRERE